MDPNQPQPQPQQVQWITQCITLLATVNTIAIAFGVYHFSNVQIEAVDAAISAVGALAGNILTHRK